jgi:hypothetical protein
MTKDQQHAGSLTGETTSIDFETPFIQQLRASRRPATIDKRIPVVSDKPDDEENTAYMVHTVDTLLLPDDHEDLDVVEHQVTVWACTCPHFHHRIRPETIRPDTLTPLRHPADDDRECKHIREAKYHDPDLKYTRDGQGTLADVSVDSE